MRYPHPLNGNVTKTAECVKPLALVNVQEVVDGTPLVPAGLAQRPASFLPAFLQPGSVEVL